MTPDLLKRIIADQKEEETVTSYIERSAAEKLALLAENKEIIVITGVRRCGKSVLLKHTLAQHNTTPYYFNFEDERLINFTVEDFQILQEIFIELFGIQKNYYFDEIQNIEGWELFVRRLYNAGNKVYLTGSNATLFSDELGTRLTGRYVSLKMYPFSFYEFVNAKGANILSKKLYSTTDIGQIKQLFNQYCHLGGFPAYVEYQQVDYLHALYESILYRDIIARYKINNIAAFKALVYFLASNCSKEITYNSLRKLLGLGSTTTISEYCRYLENSYLCFFINRYSESIKAQVQAAKKVYFIDHILAKIIGFHFSDDYGRMLENIVFLELKRQNFDIYYHKENKECDFIIRTNGPILHAIQVCQSLENIKTKQREIAGLIEALERYHLKEGYIITANEEENISLPLYQIKIIPIWKWLLRA